jgi:hypothetical protein
VRASHTRRRPRIGAALGAGIYLIQGDEQLVEMTEQPYDSEDLLQELLARYPNLLAGDGLRAAPRRWLLISREVAVPSERDGADRWSLDHLFVDQEAVPTLVEVKRRSDTRIRREVVGQMLDYAANAVVYWPGERLRATFEAGCEAEGRDPQQLIADLLETDDEAEEFWAAVDTNLQAGRVRLVFVADEIPSELARIIEFLNTQMRPAEVLGIEIKQFVGEGLRTLVPRFVGQTAEAEQRKGRVRTRKEWNEELFLEAVQEQCTVAEAQVVQRFMQWARQSLPEFGWGKGAAGSFVPGLTVNEIYYRPVVMYLSEPPALEFRFAFLRDKPPFDEEAKRIELLERLNRVPTINLPPSAIDRRPNVPLARFEDEDAFAALIEALDWCVAEIRGHGGKERLARRTGGPRLDVGPGLE